jgi:hypothetical protein
MDLSQTAMLRIRAGLSQVHNKWEARDRSTDQDEETGRSGMTGR